MGTRSESERQGDRRRRFASEEMDPKGKSNDHGVRSLTFRLREEQVSRPRGTFEVANFLSREIRRFPEPFSWFTNYLLIRDRPHLFAKLFGMSLHFSQEKLHEIFGE